MYLSSQMTLKKGNQSNTPFNNKRKHKLKKDSHNEQVISASQNFPCMWNEMLLNVPTSSIPLPGKSFPDCYESQQESPEILNKLNDSGGLDRRFFRKLITQLLYTTALHNDMLFLAKYTSMLFNAFAIMSLNPTSFPAPIPGNHTAKSPARQITYVPVTQMMLKHCYKNYPSRTLESSTLIKCFALTMILILQIRLSTTLGHFFLHFRMICIYTANVSLASPCQVITWTSTACGSPLPLQAYRGNISSTLVDATHT
ncbi:uncharacterized protein TNCV_646031 [Trichonephila clavipes]|nr:uncharacterized protein TNCV_646031 [Trichonephila clavipes]